MAQGEHLEDGEAGEDGGEGKHAYMIGVCALQR
jgi:hypothetical protein